MVSAAAAMQQCDNSVCKPPCESCDETFEVIGAECSSTCSPCIAQPVYDDVGDVSPERASSWVIVEGHSTLCRCVQLCRCVWARGGCGETDVSPSSSGACGSNIAEEIVATPSYVYSAALSVRG